jgi:hypothetical protein
MGHTDGMINSKMIGEDLCLADSCTTHTILKNKKYFQYLILNKVSVNIISSLSNLIHGSRRANIILPKGTKFCIDDDLYSSKSRRNLISFKDIRLNGYHVETTNEGSDQYLYITSIISGQKLILEKLSAFSSGLYYITIRTIELHVVINKKYSNPKMFMLWHDRLTHLGTIMMCQIIENSHQHPLKNQKILLPSDYPCAACSQGKLIIKPSLSKVIVESPSFLQRIQEDICGLIHLPCGPFRYFMVLIDASTKWSHVCLLFTRNVAFVGLLA